MNDEDDIYARNRVAAERADPSSRGGVMVDPYVALFALIAAVATTTVPAWWLTPVAVLGLLTF